MMLRTMAAVLAGAGFAGSAFGLTTGDIAFTSFNADEDGWSIVTFVDLAPNTTVYFNDNEWDGTTFNTGEGAHTWNTGGLQIDAGTVVRFSAVDKVSRSVSLGTLASTGDTGLNATNETVYAFLGTGSAAPTTFLAGVASEGATNLAPAGLTGGVNAVILTNSTDYAQYTGARNDQLNFAAYRPIVNNAANWNILVGGDQAGQIPDTTPFAPIPEPSTYAMFAAGILGLAMALRRQAAR